MIHYPPDKYPVLEEYLLHVLRLRPQFRAGGRSERSMDCVGLVVAVCARVGVHLEFEDAKYETVRHARLANPFLYEEQIKRNFHVVMEPTPPAPGDLLLFRMTEGGPINHSGWMLDSGEIVHLYDDERGISRTDWTTRFWRPKYAGYAYPRESRWAARAR